MLKRIKYWLGLTTNYNPNYKGYRPSNKQIQFVIDNLQKYVDRYPNAKLDMKESYVNCRHKCGTVHCHAGNYAVQALNDGRLTGIVHYKQGAYLMSKDLGFVDKECLKIWADNNPKIWGNNDGNSMFFSEIAFYHETKRPHGALNNQHIIDHWKEVLKRNY